METRAVEENTQEETMRFMDPPSLDSPARGRSGDDLDGLLSAYFRAEMPDPWPAVVVPEEAPELLPLPMPARRSLFRSRLALAASVALLLVGPWMLSDSFTKLDRGSTPSIDGGSASRLTTEIEALPGGGSRIRINAYEGTPAEKKIMDDINNMLDK